MSSYAVERLIAFGLLTALSGNRRYSSLNPDQVDQVVATRGRAWPSCWAVRRRSGRSRPRPGSAYAG